MDISELSNDPARFLNRELSWLDFNRRVWEEANNPAHPLFERVRFLSICASNMDEFYMVRVAGIMEQYQTGVSEDSIDGMSPEAQLKAIHKKALALIEDMQTTWRRLLSELRGAGIHILRHADLSRRDRTALGKIFTQDILPLLTPIAIQPAHPFPFIPNKGLAVALQMFDHAENKTKHVVLPVPAMLDRFIRLPGRGERYMLIEKIIIRNIHQIFPDHMEVVNYAAFRVIRDGELEIEDDAEDLVRTFESALKRRRRGQVIAVHVHQNISPEIRSYLQRRLALQTRQIVMVNGLVGLADGADIIDTTRGQHLFAPFNARFPERIREHHGDCFAAIAQKDIVVHHPYESFDVVVKFLQQAARDPDVQSIKQTLYRTSADSPIISALIEAADNGKSVTALVELKARFDEEANLRWARNMERAGVQVVYGFQDLKTHAKISLVTRREDQKLISYAHFGTGNYHPDTARIYTDLSFFTCDPALCRDAGRLFNYMTGGATPEQLEKIAVSPINLRETLEGCIDQEIANAKAGRPAGIWIKCNAVLDSMMIDKLYQASRAGVAVDIIARGICTLRPGIPGFSEHIEVKSIVGRFLEHARIYAFANGAALPSGHAKVFMSSADLMKRNLSRRIEVLVPVENKTVHRQILQQIMVANLKDRQNSWQMDSEGQYVRMTAGPQDFSAHDYFMTNPSLSGRGRSLKEAPMPPRLSLQTQTTPEDV